MTMASRITFGLLLVMLWPIIGQCVLLQIEQFYSRSFLPNAIEISYDMTRGEAINYNLTIREHFPGKLLMNIFVRKLAGAPGVANVELMRFRNLDFCKTLESLRNLTTDNLEGESIMPKTFLMSCPLTPGFYYIVDGVVDMHYLPTHLDDGHYFVQFELIQVYDEVTKLLNCKAKCFKLTPEGEEEEEEQQRKKNLQRTKSDDSDEEQEQPENAEGEVDEDNAAASTPSIQVERGSEEEVPTKNYTDSRSSETSRTEADNERSKEMGQPESDEINASETVEASAELQEDHSLL